MRKSLFAALAGLSALALSAPANAVIINFGATNPIPANNDFTANLAGLGLTQYATTGATLTLPANSILTFHFLGSESGFNDRFTASTVDYTEFTSLINNFGSPTPLGSAVFAAGSLAGLLNFSAVGGAAATVGQDGFGIFLGPNAVSGGTHSVFYLGYDDQINNVDDNHDDMIIRVAVGPVPEPGTWAMMLLGFGAIGFAMRRRPSRSFRLAQAKG